MTASSKLRRLDLAAGMYDQFLKRLRLVYSCRLLRFIHKMDAAAGCTLVIDKSYWTSSVRHAGKKGGRGDCSGVERSIRSTVVVATRDTHVSVQCH